ncbi:MAG TPA: hypothetical protein VFC44_00375 [Candidatus Saccharimonadales bacterium]|nr:hypothetical protein [Candidatus Saccharimonadales bacterium]
MQFNTRYFPLLLTALIVCGTGVVFAQVYQDYSNQTVKNDTGKPMSLIAIGDVGDLYITGKEAKFDQNQKIFKGSGYMQAYQGKYISVVAEYKLTQPGKTEVGYNQMQFRVSRIDWDDDGKTTQVLGVNPVLQTMGHPDLKIKSNLETPTVTNGILKLDVEEIGKVSLDIRFGYKAKLVGDPVVIAVDVPSNVQALVKKKMDTE